MSLLLDARKKLHQLRSAQESGHPPAIPELNAEQAMPEPGTRSTGNARSAGQNLFAAKSSPLPAGRALPNRNLLFALGGTILLLAAGAGYFWYLDSASNTTPLRPINVPPPQPLAQTTPPAAVNEPAAQSAPQIAAAPAAAEPEAAATIQQTQDKPAANNQAATQARSGVSRPASAAPIRMERKIIEPQVDPLLDKAYLAYRSGKLEEARQSYLAMLGKDAENTDALLGLASIAHQQGDAQTAAQYYGRVLALDPRNALSNAGMSALIADDDYNESRLKTLLREQSNSAALHFALGNLYAGQSRWGEAQQAYFNAYTLEPGNAEFAFNLAVCLDHLGQKGQAAQHYQHAMQLDPSHNAGFDHAQASQRAQELMR